MNITIDVRALCNELRTLASKVFTDRKALDDLHRLVLKVPAQQDHHGMTILGEAIANVKDAVTYCCTGNLVRVQAAINQLADALQRPSLTTTP